MICDFKKCFKCLFFVSCSRYLDFKHFKDKVGKIYFKGQTFGVDRAAKGQTF